MKSVYIHIPFCKYICSYCDFCKKYINKQPTGLYLAYLEKEILLYNKDRIEVDTIFIGGGTPSSLPLNEVVELGRILNKYFKVKGEFTIECNPDDLSHELLQAFKDMGVNRLSIGVQTLNDQINLENNRLHTKADVIKGLDLARNYFDNISLDFIFNLPKQTMVDINETMDFIKEYQDVITHVSYYSLILEANTILDTRDYQLLDEYTESDWYEHIVSSLKNLGYEQYEISNFTKPGCASVHNQVYWKNESYYGFGLGASGYLNRVRYTNIMALKTYFEMIDAGEKPYMKETYIDDNDFREESILLGLRTSAGIDLRLLEGIDFDQNKFIIKDNKIMIKPEFYFISSEIIVNLLEKLDALK